jgi:ABC-type microcin C transport system duplicated ATPase subunit YejF
MQSILIIADEPTRGLDVTIQAQIVELMKDLIKNSGASMLLITHDLSLAAQLCDKSQSCIWRDCGVCRYQGIFQGAGPSLCQEFS